MLYSLSLSGGKDSAATTLLLLKALKEQPGRWPLDVAIFFDSGKEFVSVYDVVYRQLEPRLNAAGIPLVTVYPRTSYDYNFAERVVNKGKPDERCGYGWCGGPCRWFCGMKNEAINAFFRDKGPVHHYVGIAANEERRAARLEHAAHKGSPLFESGMTEKDALDLCRKEGIRWDEGGVDLYDVLTRTSCRVCQNKNLTELATYYWVFPDYWQELCELQKKTAIPMKRYGTVFELEKRFRAEGCPESLAPYRRRI